LANVGNDIVNITINIELIDRDLDIWEITFRVNLDDNNISVGKEIGVKKSQK